MSRSCLLHISKVVALLFIAASLLIGPDQAAAATNGCGTCSGTLDLGPEPCTGRNGCTGSYEQMICSWGCSCGVCHDNGSSGLCCSTRYNLPNIYLEPGTCDECGEIAAHARAHEKRRSANTQQSVELRQDYSPGLIMLTPTVTYREPAFFYAADCSHTYQLIAEESPVGRGGK